MGKILSQRRKIICILSKTPVKSSDIKGKLFMDPVSVVFGYFRFLKFSGKNRENQQIRKQNSGWTVMLSQKKYYNKFGTYPKNLVLIALG